MSAKRVIDQNDFIEATTQTPRTTLNVRIPPKFIAEVADASTHAARIDIEAGGTANIDEVFTRVASELQAARTAAHANAMERYGKTSKSLRALDGDFTSWIAPQNEVGTIAAPLHDAERDVRAVVSDFRSHHQPLIVREFEAKDAYATFINTHKLRLNPSAPVAHDIGARIGWILTAVIFEITLNGFFFQNASEYGLLGAITDVIVIAPVNVLLAVLITTWSWRYASHCNPWLRWSGRISSVVLGLTVVAFNIYLAAVRISLRPDIRMSVSQAIDTIFSSRIFSVVDYNALGVFFFGLVFAGFAAFKASLLFHPYPGFGPVMARRDLTVEAATSHENEAIEVIRTMGRRAEAEFIAADEKHTNHVQNARRLCEALETDASLLHASTQRLIAASELAEQTISANYGRFVGLSDRLVGKTLIVNLECVPVSLAEAYAIRDRCSERLIDIRSRTQEYERQLQKLIADSVDRINEIAREVRVSVRASPVVQPMRQSENLSQLRKSGG